jgi:hypothetical protein
MRARVGERRRVRPLADQAIGMLTGSDDHPTPEPGPFRSAGAVGFEKRLVPVWFHTKSDNVEARHVSFPWAG